MTKENVRKSIPFNKPYLQGRELLYIAEAVASGKISGDGLFTKKCSDFFRERFGFRQPLLTTSCTDALEMAALLLDISEGDEVILPSYTFVSTANAFVLRGAKLVFADSESAHPNIDAALIEPLISSKTKAIVVVHYAGVACDMKAIGELGSRYGIAIVEDAAQAIDSYFDGRPLGTFGALAAFSFHETKNVISGEGGLLCVNDDALSLRAEIIREKGTNRAAFFRGEIDKYGWVDIGSSFLPSDIIAAYLYAQLEQLDEIQRRRKEIWESYRRLLEPVAAEFRLFSIPAIPRYATNNGHMFYLVCQSADVRARLLAHLKEQGIHAVFHYLSLHKSSFYAAKHDGRELPNADRFSDCLVRLPLYFELTDSQIAAISDAIHRFCLHDSEQK